MRVWILALVIGVIARPLQAQDVSGEIAAGAVTAGSAGVGADLGLSLTHGSFFARVGGQVVGTGASAEWESSARVVAATLGAGVIRGPSAKHRHYGLIVLGSGLDWREADHFRSIGAALGTHEFSGRVFGEVRYERWFQFGPSHVTLPKHMIGAYLGMRTR